MSDVTAAQTPTAEASAALAEAFALHSDHLTRFIANRLDRRDWHLAEDLTSEVFVRLVRWYATRPVDSPERAFPLLARLARQVIDQHFRPARSGEIPTNFGDWFEERNLPPVPAAEDVAVMRLEARELLADRPETPTVATRRQVEALTALAVAA